MLEKIVVALDGSALGERSLPYAQELAAGLRSQISLLLVCSFEEEGHRRAFETYLQTTADNLASALQSRLMLEIAPVVSTAVVSGPAFPTIVEYADREGFGLIIMSSHGQSGLLARAMGGLASKVAQDLRVPVLMIRAAAEVGSDGLKKLLDAVLVPLDGSEAGESALPYVLRLATETETPLTLLRVLSSKAHTRTIGGIDDIDFPEGVVERMRGEAIEYLARVREQFVGARARVATQVRSGDPAVEILKAADDTGAKLIAMSSHRHSGIEKWMLGSVSGKVLHHARVPVLLVKAKGP